MIFSVFKYKHIDVYDDILFPQFVTQLTELCATVLQRNEHIAVQYYSD